MSSSCYNMNWNNHYHKNNTDHRKRHKIFLQSHSWNPSWQGCIKKWWILYQIHFNYTFPVSLCKFALILEHSQICPTYNVKSLFTANSISWNLRKIQVWFTSWIWMLKNDLIEGLISVCTPMKRTPPTFILKKRFRFYRLPL